MQKLNALVVDASTEFRNKARALLSAAGFEVDHGFVLVAGDQARHHFRHERQVADDDGVLGPAVDGGEQIVDGIVGGDTSRRFLDDLARAQDVGQQQGGFQGAQFAAVQDPAGGNAAAGQERCHAFDVLAAAIAQGPFRIFVLGLGRAMVN